MAQGMTGTAISRPACMSAAAAASDAVFVTWDIGKQGSPGLLLLLSCIRNDVSLLNAVCLPAAIADLLSFRRMRTCLTAIPESGATVLLSSLWQRSLSVGVASSTGAFRPPHETAIHLDDGVLRTAANFTSSPSLTDEAL